MGELSWDIQSLLLKAIEERSFFPFGSDRPVFSNFQLITATNSDLFAAARTGRFRMDLLARINLWYFRLPSLRERPEDIEPNIEYELKRLSERRGIFADFMPEAREAYLAFARSPEALWPGNFRTLASSMERMHTYAFQGIITTETVEKEISYLRSLWCKRTETLEGIEFPLIARAASFIDRELDLFDKVQLEKILTEGKSDLLNGFVSNRNGRKFKAYLVLDKKTGKIGFEFQQRETDAAATKAKKPTVRHTVAKKTTA